MSTPLQIAVGDEFDKWTVIDDPHRRNKDGRRVLVCQCVCGAIRDVAAKHLKAKKSKGCLRCRRGRLKHGHSRQGKESPTHFSWRGMIDRCTNPKSPSWPWYGAEGVTVCERWQRFENFLADMGERPGKQYTLERVQRALGYCPENCEWILRREQYRNRRDNHLLTFQGTTHPVITWSELTGLAEGCIRSRLKMGWSIEEALTVPSGVSRKKHATSSLSEEPHVASLPA